MSTEKISDETFRDINIPADILSKGSISPFDDKTDEKTDKNKIKNRIFKNDIQKMESDVFK